MNQPQHTPGPWKAQGSQIIQADRMEAWQLIVATLPTTIDPIPKSDAAAKTLEQRNSNAALIAAAPDLLAALKAVMAEYRDGYGLKCVDQVSAAIAKAEGREP